MTEGPEDGKGRYDGGRDSLYRGSIGTARSVDPDPNSARYRSAALHRFLPEEDRAYLNRINLLWCRPDYRPG
jgi:hypothetical protein